MTDPRTITQEELRMDFFVCKQNLDHLAKHGPHYCRQFLKQLVTLAKLSGDCTRTTKMSGLLQKEASRKRWQRVNNSMGKKRGSLTIAVKVPTADGKVDKFKTKDRVFLELSKTLTKRFQSALVAQCHRGTLYKDIGHLADGPVGTYMYPSDSDPATRLLLEEAAATYAALSPTEVATYVTMVDFQHF